MRIGITFQRSNVQMLEYSLDKAKQYHDCASVRDGASLIGDNNPEIVNKQFFFS